MASTSLKLSKASKRSVAPIYLLYGACRKTDLTALRVLRTATDSSGPSFITRSPGIDESAFRSEARRPNGDEIWKGRGSGSYSDGLGRAVHRNETR
ncbi:hypothetical protein GW17_00061820, partial [Ensete ventricosum]